MYKGAHIAVIIPAYNVETLIAKTITSVPEFVDTICVIDDGSLDETWYFIQDNERPGLLPLQHKKNRGVGAAIATGYEAAFNHGADIACVMAGDGQMDPSDMTKLLDPLIDNRAHYVKGNRFLHPDVWKTMPRVRIIGNILLSFITRLTSGYHHIFDSQCGYTALSRTAFDALQGRMFSRYGYPNDLLARLNAIGATVEDAIVRPIYGSERSGIRFWTPFYPIGWVLLQSFMRRIWLQNIRPRFSQQPAPRLLTQNPANL